jgi:hypothetical protein
MSSWDHLAWFGEIERKFAKLSMTIYIYLPFFLLIWFGEIERKFAKLSMTTSSKLFYGLNQANRHISTFLKIISFFFIRDFRIYSTSSFSEHVPRSCS